MKYVCKSCHTLILKFPEKDDENEMTVGRQVFNSRVWKYGWRLVQKSRGQSEVMRYHNPDSEINCIAVEL